MGNKQNISIGIGVFKLLSTHFPKAGGSYAWAYTIDDGDAFGLEGDRLPTRDAAIARAKVAVEAGVDSLLARSVPVIPPVGSAKAA
ncbi:MAG: hypothetical protein WDN30_04980 [Pararobbsia sp.]